MAKNNTIIIGIIILILFMNQGSNESVVGLETTGTTTLVDGHSHTYNIDANGNGLTSTNDGHFHEIFQFIVLESDGHIHELAR